MGTLTANFGNGSILLWMLEFFLFVIWFYLLIMVFGDLFRDADTSGGKKVLWTIFVIVLPYLGIFIYLIARGKGMAARSQAQVQEAQDQLDARIRATAGTATSSADQIGKAKALLDAGTIDQAEFDHLKAKALA
jgi:hypothetical protein